MPGGGARRAPPRCSGRGGRSPAATSWPERLASTSRKPSPSGQAVLIRSSASGSPETGRLYFTLPSLAMATVVGTTKVRRCASVPNRHLIQSQLETEKRSRWLINSQRGPTRPCLPGNGGPQALICSPWRRSTRQGDELARKRRELPWLRVEKEYRLDTDDGERTLAELFDGRSQLLVYHFMFGPSYEAGDPVNSSMVDGFDGLLPHLHARDLTLMLVRARRWRSFRRTSGGWAGGALGLVGEQRLQLRPGLRRPRSRCASRYSVSGVGDVDLAEALEGLPPIAHQNAAAAGTDV